MQLDTVGTVYHLVIYMQSNKTHNVVLMSKFYSALFVSSTCFGPHRSIFRSVLYKLYSQTLVGGNTRITRHFQPLQSRRKETYPLKITLCILLDCIYIIPCSLLLRQVVQTYIINRCTCTWLKFGLG